VGILLRSVRASKVRQASERVCEVQMSNQGLVVLYDVYEAEYINLRCVSKGRGSKIEDYEGF
jgi:hypothetical protein